MIEGFRHKGLRKLFDDDDPRLLNTEHVKKIGFILDVLEKAAAIEDVDLPTFRLHRLTGDLQGFWSVTVRANWRIIFRFEGGNAADVDLVDYH